MAINMRRERHDVVRHLDTTTNHALWLNESEQELLQIAVLVSCSLSFICLCYVILHYISALCGRAAAWCCRRRPSTNPTTRDFTSLLIFVLSWIDLVTVVARMVGRTVLHNDTLCQAQALILHAGGLASCIWTTCMSFNLYRWVLFGESETKRRSRFTLYLLLTILPSIGLTLYPLHAQMYGNATFYCWLQDSTAMFLHFYVYYILLAAVNIVLLVLIRREMTKSSQWHDTAQADFTSTVIRRKALLYIIIFLLHRTPMMIYRVLEAANLSSFALGLIVQVILNLDGLSNSIVYGGLCQKLPRHGLMPARPRWKVASNGSSGSDRHRILMPACTADFSMDSDETYLAKRQKNGGLLSAVPEEQQHHDRWTETTQTTAKLPRATTSKLGQHPSKTTSSSSQSHPQEPPLPSRRSQSLGIFVSTFNMGEQNILEHELIEWIPIGHEIYVLGVQECMNLGDFQTKVLHHLITTTHQKYVYYSREIGKRATALGYHGYIALTVFVLEESVRSGRFEMPARQAMSKHAQEVYRGKSLLVFGRASNKGAVGMSFRYGNTSFAFVTCHLASDSTSVLGGKKRSFRAKESVASALETDVCQTESMATQPAQTVDPKLPPSRIERRNQDAIEILQQLYLDEEDYGFGFPLLHHHSFVLGDLNYRMARKQCTPPQILDLLHQIAMGFHSTPSATSCGTDRMDMYEELTTPTTMRLKPDMSAALSAMIRDHDELTMLRETKQLFHGFEELPITFFPTFRRIRGQSLQYYDAESLSRNYSLVTNKGGYRVPSYTDRILHTSLPGRANQIQCLHYDSCEAVTTSDHKPVCAVFRVESAAFDGEDAWTESTTAAPTSRAANQLVHSFVASSSASISSSSSSPSMPTTRPFQRAYSNGDGSVCDMRLKMEFRSIQWMDAVDGGASNLFGRLDNIEFGFLFPLPCEDTLSQQRKLQEVAENLTWGESALLDATGTPTPSLTSSVASTTTSSMLLSSVAVPSTTNFHVLAWNRFVEDGIRYRTRVSVQGKKHVAILIRTRSRSRGRGASSRSRSSSSIASNGTTVSGSSTSSRSALASGSNSGGRSFTSSGSYELSLGQGTFCINEIGTRQDTSVPLTLGGNLVGRLNIRVTLQIHKDTQQEQ